MSRDLLASYNAKRNFNKTRENWLLCKIQDEFAGVPMIWSNINSPV